MSLYNELLNTRLLHKWAGCQLAYRMTKFSLPCIAEPKLDGFRLSMIVQAPERVSIHCRAAASPEWSDNCDGLADAVLALGLKPGTMVDGEVIAGNWNDTSSLLRSGISDDVLDRVLADLRFVLFDVVDLTQLVDMKPLRKVVKGDPRPYTERRAFLESLKLEAPLQLAASFPVRSEEHAMQLCGEMLDMGFEGLMLKDPAAPYAMSRNRYWQKIKPTKTFDAEVLKITEGKGRLLGAAGTIYVRAEDGRRLSVGAGFSDSMRAWIWEHREELIGSWLEVRAQADDVAIARHPAFVRWRNERNSLAAPVR